MAANTAAIFPLTPVVTWCTVTTANTAKDGTGTVVSPYLAGSNGSRLDRIVVVPLGTNVQTVLRVFVNNGSTNTVAANNILRKEVTIPASTVSETTGQMETIIPLDMALSPGQKINITIGTTIAAGLAVCAEGGDY